MTVATNPPKEEDHALVWVGVILHMPPEAPPEPFAVSRTIPPTLGRPLPEKNGETRELQGSRPQLHVRNHCSFISKQVARTEK